VSMRNTFERIYVINLERRVDRWNTFKKQIPRNWPFQALERVAAIDGKKVPSPDWWTTGNPAWGCYRTHLRLLETCMNSGVNSVLLLEDDAKFVPDFTSEVKKFIQHLPDNWGMLYLGGQHLHFTQHPPLKVNDEVFVPYNVNRTHAMALRGNTIKYVYKFLHEFQNFKKGDHIDHWLGRLHQKRNPKHPIYCPGRWLVGQAPGPSDIGGGVSPDRTWAHAAEVVKSEVDPNQQKFVAVIGLHSSGSSALAGMLHYLGVNMGDLLGGFYGTDPENSCGFEAKGLMDLCEACIPFPTIKYAKKRQAMWRMLHKWINQRRTKAAKLGMLVGGKYPMLCRLGAQLMNICQENLRVIHVDRPFHESVQSLVRREKGRHSSEVLRVHQQWLWDGKHWLLKELADKQQEVLDISFHDLAKTPIQQAERIIRYLDLKPSQERFLKAVQYIDSSRKHI